MSRFLPFFSCLGLFLIITNVGNFYNNAVKTVMIDEAAVMARRLCIISYNIFFVFCFFIDEVTLVFFSLLVVICVGLLRHKKNLAHHIKAGNIWTQSNRTAALKPTGQILLDSREEMQKQNCLCLMCLTFYFLFLNVCLWLPRVWRWSTLSSKNSYRCNILELATCQKLYSRQIGGGVSPK